MLTRNRLVVGLLAGLMLELVALPPALAQEVEVIEERRTAPTVEIESEVTETGPPALDQPRDEPAVETVRQPAQPQADRAISLHLMDGSIITGTLEIDALDVQTKFGQLTVPIPNLMSFRPGLESLSSLREKLDLLIEQLGAPDVATRDQAKRELLAIGPKVRPQLQQYRDADDPERQLQVRAILAELEEIELQMMEEEMGGEQPKELIAQDTIVTSDFTIIGKVLNESFTVQSPYGVLNVRLGDIREARRDVETGVEEIRKTITVDGANIAQVSFKNTQIRLERGDKVRIQAEGQMILTPWGSNAISTPDGAPNYGWYIQNVIPVGALVGRIGNSDQPFKIGSEHSFTADKAGVLHLAWGMHQSYINNSFPGQYKVRIRVVKGNEGN